MYSSYNDPELGLITPVPHKKARRFIFRPTPEGIRVTCPFGVSPNQIREVIESHRSGLIRLRMRIPEKELPVCGTEWRFCNFRVLFKQSSYGNKLEARYGSQVLELIIPAHTDYAHPSVLPFVSKQIDRICRLEAARYLPNRLASLAANLQLNYRSCELSYGKSRLGKCDSLRNITLSYRLMHMPAHLVDYVILHELSHLTEMNHGPRFHKLLDHYCKGNHRALEKELKAFRSYL